MTVYVDNYRAQATVGGIDGRWSHLTADTPEELHVFAGNMALRKRWFQGHCRNPRCPSLQGTCVHFHYDVIDRKRDQAIDRGARQINLREMAGLIAVRRRQFTFEPGLDIAEPCQPIGCDNDIHLPGCLYRFADYEDTPAGRKRRVRVAGDLFHGSIPEGAIYVGRQAPGLPRSRWANPFKAGRATPAECQLGGITFLAGHYTGRKPATPGEAVDWYRTTLRMLGLHDQVVADLAGADLACWCRPPLPCHVDVLLEVCNAAATA